MMGLDLIRAVLDSDLADQRFRNLACQLCCLHLLHGVVREPSNPLIAVPGLRSEFHRERRVLAVS